MKKFFTFLAAALMSVGMFAQTETLLTTITATGTEQASYSTEGVANVSFSRTQNGNLGYLAVWGWWGYGMTLTVTPAEGYTITKCIFYDDANRTATDSEAPFVVETTEEDKTPRINGTPILADESKGIKKIEVYGYENPTTVAVTGVTLDQNEAQMTVGGETLTLTATVNPNNATDQSVSWSTSDANVATVNNGVVTAVAAGNATITVTTTDGSFTATCAITVTAPEPQGEVTVVFAANNKTVERTVTLPHTFKCSWDNGMDGPDELDIIIHELYNDYYYCNSNMNASGSDQVEAGTEENPKNDYITIKGVFEGTATVTGDYFDWITGEEGEHSYSITISIKGDEPDPAKYYIVGNMTNWEVNENYEMNPSLEAETEEYFYGLELTTASQFKVVKVEGETQTWYPDGMGNNYGENGEIERDGDYTIYFRPALDGDDDWFYNCIMAIRHATPERVVVGALFPENGKPTEGVKIFGSFSEEEFDMTLIIETGGYIHSEIMAADQDEFMFRDAADEENVLVVRNAEGQWEDAVFTFDEEWEQDTYKGEPVKMIDMDLSDNSKYAWANAIPEGLEEVLSEKAESRKVMLNGMLYIVRDGKMYNVLGVEVK